MSRRRKVVNESEARAVVTAQPDRFVQETFDSVRTQAERCLADVTRYARRSPENTILAAVAGGYVLRMLPLTRILGGVSRLALGLVKPAILIYGVAKLWNKAQVREDR